LNRFTPPMQSAGKALFIMSRQSRPDTGAMLLRRGSAAALLAAAAALTLGACDVPTALPRLEPRFVMPLEETVIRVDELLPAGVTAHAGAFRLALAPATVQGSLGQLCGSPCGTVHQLVLPKPEFTGVFTVTLSLPADVAAAVLASGAAQVAVHHTFDFDPLRPAGATSNGTLQAVVRSGARQLGSATADQSFPAGTTISRTIPLEPGLVSGPVEVRVTIHSPAGSPVFVDTAKAMTVTVTPTDISITELTALVTGRPISVQPATLDLTGVEIDVRKRVRGGALVLIMDNPFAVGGTLQLRLFAPTTAADIQRAVQVTPGATTQRIELGAQEVALLLGARVEVTLAGPVSATSPIVLRPNQEVRLSTRFELVLEIGG
jgi:hypothetical protein